MCHLHAYRTRARYSRKYFGESPLLLDVDAIRVSDSSTARDFPIYGQGVVLDLVAKVPKRQCILVNVGALISCGTTLLEI